MQTVQSSYPFDVKALKKVMLEFTSDRIDLLGAMPIAIKPNYNCDQAILTINFQLLHQPKGRKVTLFKRQVTQSISKFLKQQTASQPPNIVINFTNLSMQNLVDETQLKALLRVLIDIEELQPLSIQIDNTNTSYKECLLRELVKGKGFHAYLQLTQIILTLKNKLVDPDNPSLVLPTCFEQDQMREYLGGLCDETRKLIDEELNYTARKQHLMNVVLKGLGIETKQDGDNLSFAISDSIDLPTDELTLIYLQQCIDDVKFLSTTYQTLEENKRFIDQRLRLVEGINKIHQAFIDIFNSELTSLIHFDLKSYRETYDDGIKILGKLLEKFITPLLFCTAPMHNPPMSLPEAIDKKLPLSSDPSSLVSFLVRLLEKKSQDYSRMYSDTQQVSVSDSSTSASIVSDCDSTDSLVPLSSIGIPEPTSDVSSLSIFPKHSIEPSYPVDTEVTKMHAAVLPDQQTRKQNARKKPAPSSQFLDRLSQGKPTATSSSTYFTIKRSSGDLIAQIDIKNTYPLPNTKHLRISAQAIDPQLDLHDFNAQLQAPSVISLASKNRSGLKIHQGQWVSVRKAHHQDRLICLALRQTPTCLILPYQVVNHKDYIQLCKNDKEVIEKAKSFSLNVDAQVKVNEKPRSSIKF